MPPSARTRARVGTGIVQDCNTQGPSSDATLSSISESPQQSQPLTHTGSASLQTQLPASSFESRTMAPVAVAMGDVSPPEPPMSGNGMVRSEFATMGARAAAQPSASSSSGERERQTLTSPQQPASVPQLQEMEHISS